jgi:rhodanese-related sulfurtransferase
MILFLFPKENRINSISKNDLIATKKAESNPGEDLLFRIRCFLLNNLLSCYKCLIYLCEYKLTSKTYVCYCDGIGCNASTKGALNMAKLGFKVKELIGGIEWWKFDGYATAGAEKSDGLNIQCLC